MNVKVNNFVRRQIKGSGKTYSLKMNFEEIAKHAEIQLKKKSFHNGLKETLEWYINNKKFFNYFSKKIFFKRLGLNI